MTRIKLTVTKVSVPECRHERGAMMIFQHDLFYIFSIQKKGEAQKVDSAYTTHINCVNRKVSANASDCRYDMIAAIIFLNFWWLFMGRQSHFSFSV